MTPPFMRGRGRWPTVRSRGEVIRITISAGTATSCPLRSLVVITEGPGEGVPRELPHRAGLPRRGGHEQDEIAIPILPVAGAQAREPDRDGRAVPVGPRHPDAQRFVHVPGFASVRAALFWRAPQRALKSGRCLEFVQTQTESYR